MPVSSWQRYPYVVNTQPELLAHHYMAVGCYEQAVHYWQRAGTAAAKSAYQEAAVHLERALETLQQLPESRERTAQANMAGALIYEI